MASETQLSINIPHNLRESISAALFRLGYIFPDFVFEVSETGIGVRGQFSGDTFELEREVLYQVYRENIFQKTLPMRRDLYRMLSD